MKFLITTKQKDAFLMVPQEMRAEIFKGMVAFVDKYRKAGKCKEIYWDSEMKGSISIWECVSNEEGAQMTLENPIAPFANIDTRPIAEWDVGVKLMAELISKAAKK